MLGKASSGDSMRFGVPIGGRRKITLRWIREVLEKNRVRKMSWSENEMNLIFVRVKSRERERRT